MKEIGCIISILFSAADLFHDVPEAASWCGVPGHSVSSAAESWMDLKTGEWLVGNGDIVTRCLHLIITGQTCCDNVHNNYYNISTNNFTPLNNLFNTNRYLNYYNNYELGA